MKHRALLALTLLLATVTPAALADSLPRLISVSATDYVEAVPDEMVLTVTLKATELSYEQAREAVDEQTASVLVVADELGLAIVGKDKQVTVVEDANKLYPEIYKARFQGKQVMAMGKVVKQQGKVTWIQPTSLKLAN